MTRIIDHYGDGAWYDAEYVHITADIPAYAAWAQSRRGPILELACGTGRLTLPMAAAGPRVVGVDLSSAMIARAIEKSVRHPGGVRSEFVVGDMRTVRLHRQFDAVIVGFNSLMHMLGDDDLSRAFETIRSHLPVGGWLALDVFGPPPAALGRDSSARFDPQQMIDPRNGRRFIVTESSSYDPASRVHHLRIHYDPVDRAGLARGESLRADLALRVMSAAELDGWLSRFGFEVRADWDDLWRTQPYSGTGGRRFVEAVRGSSTDCGRFLLPGRLRSRGSRWRANERSSYSSRAGLCPRWVRAWPALPSAH